VYCPAQNHAPAKGNETMEIRANVVFKSVDWFTKINAAVKKIAIPINHLAPVNHLSPFSLFSNCVGEVDEMLISLQEKNTELENDVNTGRKRLDALNDIF
jgi:hypothetical protein